MKLAVLPETFAVCRLDPLAAVPEWASGDFVAVTRTADSLSLVCTQDYVPDDVRCQRDWRCLQVAEQLDLTVVGVIASLSVPLACANVSVFIVSTFDTDFFMVQQADLEQTIRVLEEDGHQISDG